MTAELAVKDYIGKDFEIINGQVYLMSPVRLDHAIITGRIYRMFANYLEGKKCMPIPDGVKVVVKSKKGKQNSLVPDFMVVCDRKKLFDNKVIGAPDLVVEVLSTSTRKKDITVKKDAYEEMGVKEYWIVDIKSKAIDRYLLVEDKFELENSYGFDDNYEDFEMLEGLPPTPSVIKVSLYDDLLIDLNDIFNY